MIALIDKLEHMCSSQLITLQVSSLEQNSSLFLNLGSQSQDIFLVSNNARYGCVVQWQNDSCHLQFFTVDRHGLKLHSTTQYEHVTAVRRVAANLEMTCVTGAVQRITWPVK